MKVKFIALLIWFLFPHIAWTESEVFKLNGKPVPDVVAKVNGTALNSTQLEREFASFRLRTQAQGKTIAPDEENLIARELLKAEIMKALIAENARSLNIKITTEKLNLEIQNIN